jgi:streptogramin lyase
VRKEVPQLAVDAGWPTIPVGAKFGEVSAVDLDADGNVWVLHRAGRVWEEPFPKEPIAEPTVFKFAPDGTLLAQWGAGLFIMPHGLSIDAAGKVWITDVGHEQVFRFSPDGTQELVIGEQGVSAQDATHFGRPADVAFLAERVMVADGYVNTRVAEFTPQGKFLRGAHDADIVPHEAADFGPVLLDDDFLVGVGHAAFVPWQNRGDVLEAVPARAPLQRIERRMRRRIGICDIIAEIRPHRLAGRARAQHADQIEQQAERHRQRITRPGASAPSW